MFMIFSFSFGLSEEELSAVENALTNPSRYFGVDIRSIQAYAKKYSDIEHIRCEIR